MEIYRKEYLFIGKSIKKLIYFLTGCGFFSRIRDKKTKAGIP